MSHQVILPSIEAADDSGDAGQPSDRPSAFSKTTSATIVPHRPDESTLDPMAEQGDAPLEEKIRKRIHKILDGKEEEWTAVATKKGPLRLLDLPMDILKEIFKQVTHTNDLTSLARTHSALHSLAVPHIYSRFDIVWPEVTPSTEGRGGVDALTYGLATLVMGRDSFPAKMRRRIGNNYPQYTRKFSLGNGPEKHTQEYLITKDSGKMLGTLVALAVARMSNLEQFVWDMPTGVVRDVWLALSSLEDRSASDECRLEKVAVRWHDNTVDLPFLSPSAPSIPPGTQVTPIGILYGQAAIALSMASTAAGNNADHGDLDVLVEYPTFSVLPPLKSLSVLDIDEVSYLDEMSILIHRSRHKLEELRVGISQKAQWKNFVMAWDGPNLQQLGSSPLPQNPRTTLPEVKRLGGVLGILLGRIYDLRRKKTKDAHECIPPWDIKENSSDPGDDFAKDPTVGEVDAAIFTPEVHNDTVATEPSASDGLPEIAAALGGVSLGLPKKQTQASRQPSAEAAKRAKGIPYSKREKQVRSNMLRLKVLELERIPLSVAVLQRGFDWSALTSLTLLDCSYHEQFWRMLRRQFQPRSPGHGLGSLGPPTTPVDYQLNLKKVHTDHVTPALISFLKETLAPNSLEVLFLQNRKSVTSNTSVTIDQIYKGPLRRHRKSLRKLLIDSSDRLPKAPGNAVDALHPRWKTWMATHEVLAFITSGSMCSLRELSIAIDYKDWHFFLRRLPQLSTLHSLNIPHIGDHVTTAYDPRELAMQIVDMIFLRPEIELCYLGIANKCFEILENRPDLDRDRDSGPDAVHGAESEEDGEALSEDEDGDDDEDEDEENDDEDADENDVEEVEGADGAEPVGGSAAEGLEQMSPGAYAASEAESSDEESEAGSLDDKHNKLNLKLREILYYDDKVAIFRARHMKL